MWLINRFFDFSYREKSRTLRLILMGVFVHFVLFYGVMDAYFSSPVLHGLPSHSAKLSISKRIVVFVSDGLRAEEIFSDDNATYTPYLNHIKNQIGAWGVCHTRVPTESRPGHVAIFAGMYEDPHAVTRGWKYNPIDFDHVFNQSQISFLWGSPDIVPMFNKDNIKKIYTDYYEPSYEDFSGQQSTLLLDDWVFRKVQTVFETNHPTLRKEKSIFFLHLLGMDTAGHVYKPNSKKYNDNLIFVDQGIKKIVALMDRFFEDYETTYIFTSDHGMTNWGSHGSGSAHETEAPFIIWGSGVKPNGVRQDLKQADITAIISFLLGINNPINSVGIFQNKYFELGDWELAHILYANVLTLAEQYKVQQNQLERNQLSFFYKGLDALRNLDEALEDIRLKIESRKYEEAINATEKLIPALEKGKFEMNHYLRVPILICLAAGLAVYMIYIACIMFYSTERIPNPKCIEDSELIDLCGKILVTLAIAMSVLLYKGLQIKYCAYLCFPFLMVLCLMHDGDQLQYLVVLIDYINIKDAIKCGLIVAGVYFLSLTLIHREYIVYTCIGIVIWMLLEKFNIKRVDKIIWLVLTLYLPLYYQVTPMFRENYHIICIMGAVIVLYISLIFTLDRIFRKSDYFHLTILITQVFCMVLSVINVAFTSYYKNLSPGLMTYVYVSSWSILVLCLITMTLHPRRILPRILGIEISIFNVYFLMTANGEGLFMALFVCLCLTWSFTEMEVSKLAGDVTVKFGTKYPMKDSLSYDDFRKCFIFMTYILLSFFGPGNISDLNTFDPMWTRCFVKVFNPYLMASLIGLKLMIPFFITTLNFRMMNVFGRTSILGTFSVILFYSEIMVLNMMFRVTNEGSWLEIGLSISRFVIANVITIALLVIYSLVRLLTDYRLFDTLNIRFYQVFCIENINYEESSEDELMDVFEKED